MSKKKIVSAGLTALMLGTQVAPVVAAKDVKAPVVGVTATKDGGKLTLNEGATVTVNYYKDGKYLSRAYLNKKLAKGTHSWAKRLGAGNWTVKVWAKDAAGNSTAKSLTVKVGTTAPVVKTEVTNLAVTQTGDVATFNFNLNKADKANVEVNLLPNIPATVAVVDGVAGANSVSWTIDKSVVNGTYNVKVKAGESFVTGTLTIKRVAANLAVEKVEGVDAKTIKVTFNKEVDKASVVDSSGLLTSAFTLSALGTAPVVNIATAKASLSADGLVLTIVASGTEVFKGQYALTISDTVKDKATTGKLTTYSGVFSNTDTVRPVISGPTYVVNNKATFTASEPVQPGTVAIAVITDEAGVVSATGATVAVATDNKSFTVDLSGFTLDKNYKVTFVGIKDFAENLITPNPVTFTVKNTKVDSVAPTVTNIEATKVNEFKVTFSEKVTSFNYTLNGGAGTGTKVADTAGTTWTVTDAAAVSGAHLIAVTGAADASGIVQTAAFSKFVQFNADVTAPTYVSHEVKTILGKQYLAVKYSETVVVTGASLSITGTSINSSQVTSAITPISVPGAYVTIDTTDKTLVLINLTDSGLLNANFTLNLPSGLAYDGTNGTAAKVVSFSVGATPATSDTTKPGVSATTIQTTADTVTITFSENVAAATALNVANYTVEGQAVFASAILDGAQNKVTLKLNPNAIGVTGLRQLTIKNVTDVAGNVMTDYNTTVNFIENVKPVITTAKLTSNNQITVTFSEAVANVNAADFLVKVAGVGNTITGVTATNTSTYVVSFTTPITDLSKAIALTVQGTNDIVDTTTPANALTTTGDVTVTQ